jgi:multidrug efflux pump subunit AcrA (membrane-fusion protein)
VYIPEDQVGSIKLEQKATLTVDSFPGQVFNASVVKIADKAEFTPRNVSTVEGRKTTVFAITLQIEDPDGQLKAGMPADVVFQP